MTARDTPSSGGLTPSQVSDDGASVIEGGAALSATDELCLSAPLFATQVDVLREMLGAEGMERTVESLPDHLADLARAAPRLGWVPYEHVEQIVTVAAAYAGQPVAEFQHRMVLRVAERTFSGIWGILVRLTSPRALMKRAAALFRRTYSKGQLSWVSDAKGCMQLALRGVQSPSDYFLRGVAYSVETALRHTGATGVRFTMKRLPNGADYELTWRT